MFKLKDVFNIYKGKRLTKADMIEGDINYIGAISDDNGVREKIGQDAIFIPNCITVNYNGSVGEAFYQIKPFWASDDVNVLYLKDMELNENFALYLITIIKANKYKFSYGRKWTLDKMNDTEIPLPVNFNGDIDWNFIEEKMCQLKNKHITTKIVYKNNDLNFNTWKQFLIKDIFDCDMDVSEILLSSDGLTGMLDREQIEKVLLGEGNVEDKVTKLINKANNRGGTDNISVAYLVRFEEGEDK